jgi:TonB family protein
VSVSSSGAASATKILQSSGNAVLDRDAVNLAKENGYEPAMRNCKPVAGTYTFVFTSAGAK